MIHNSKLSVLLASKWESFWNSISEFCRWEKLTRPADLRAERGQIAEVARKDAVDSGFISWHLVAFLFLLGRLFHLSLGFLSL